jgi:hypothetical protein
MQKKATNNNGNWQPITMSSLVQTMLTDMKLKFDENNGDLSCSEEV